jgi:hypothetical protein
MLFHFDVGVDVDFYFFDFLNLGDVCFVGAERTQCRLQPASIGALPSDSALPGQS